MSGPGTINGRYTNFDVFPSEEQNGISQKKIERLNGIFSSTSYTSLANTITNWKRCQTTDLDYARSYWVIHDFNYSYGVGQPGTKLPNFSSEEQFPKTNILYHPNLKSPGPSPSTLADLSSTATDKIHINIPENGGTNKEDLVKGPVKYASPGQRNPTIYSARVARSVVVGQNYPVDSNGDLELFE